MENKCGNCGKDCGKYKFCAKCNARYEQTKVKAELVNQLKNINMNLGHLVALYAEEHPESEKIVKQEWEKKKQEKEEQDEAARKLEEEQDEEEE